MDYQRGDRWRGDDENRWQGNRYEREGGGFGNWGGNRDRGDWDRGRERERGSWGGERDRSRSEWRGDHDRDDDRGFFERAGETVRSWFSDDDDRYEGERGRTGLYGRQDRDYRPDSASAYGNQSNERYGAGGGGMSYGGGYADDVGIQPASTWGGGFDSPENSGRRFDRIDVGSVGTHGAHPMSAPVSGGYGTSAHTYGSSARSAEIMRRSRQGGMGSGGRSRHDPQYSEWRQRQIDELDRDYDEYRSEHQSKFEQEFGGWRNKRQTQRQHMGRVTEHMEVMGSDGQHIGTVDAVKGDRIILTKSDEKAGGRHHSIPCSWIENVDDKVTVNKSSEEATKAWRDEENSRALFEREDQGSKGPHMLNRSFSGTYDDDR